VRHFFGSKSLGNTSRLYKWFFFLKLVAFFTILNIGFYQYFHLVLLCNTFIFSFWSIIYLCNTFIICGLTFIWNVNFHIRFIIFVFWVSDAIALPLVAIESVHWTSDGIKWACGLVVVMGVMHPIPPSTTWYNICKCATMWLWN
jgi:hypothetical protein